MRICIYKETERKKYGMLYILLLTDVDGSYMLRGG